MFTPNLAVLTVAPGVLTHDLVVLTYILAVPTHIIIVGGLCTVYPTPLT